MKQKLAVMLLAAGMAFSCTFAFTACNDTPTADNGGDPVITPGDDDTPTTPDDDEQHEHSYTSEVTTQPTCTQEGVMTYTCTCGDSYTEAIPTIAHTYVDGVCTECGAPEPQPTEGLVFTLSEDEMEYAVTRYRGAATEVYIPATYEGLPVTSIGMSAFQLCRSLTSVIIPDSITSIGEWAFYNCSSLTSITIPDSVTSIGMSAFQECSSLTSITIPDSVTSIELMAFYNCSSLSSITIPDSVTSIGSEAFSGCSSLTSITIPDSATSIGPSVPSGCSNVESITVASGNPVYHSADNCLIETASKTLVSGCKNSIIPTDGSVTSIGGRAFSESSSLTSITIPDNITSIGDAAFYGCSSLTSITIPDSVTSIGSYAFSGCSSLTSITIPDSVTSIGRFAFSGCNTLTSVTFENTEEWIVESWDGQINNIDVTDPAQNVVYLTDTYRLNVWTRSE